MVLKGGAAATAFDVGRTHSNPVADGVIRSSSRHRGSLDDRWRTCLRELGVKHTLQLEIVLHLRLNHMFKLCNSVVLNASFLLSLPLEFKDLLAFTGK